MLKSQSEPQLSPFQQQLQDAGSFYSRLVLVPTILADLNRHGFSQPARLSALFADCLLQPAQQIRFTVPPSDEKSPAKLWHFTDAEEVEQQDLGLTPEHFERLIELAAYTPDLRSVPEAPQKGVDSMFGAEQRSLINLPMYHCGNLVAAFHMAAPAPHAFDDHHLLMAQVLANTMTAAFAHFHLQNQHTAHQARQRHIQVHYKRLHNVLQQTREAFEKSDSNVAELKQLCQTLKARAWENQERCAALEQELKKIQKENNQLSNQHQTNTANIPAPAQASPASASTPAVETTPAQSKSTSPLGHEEVEASVEAGALLREIATPAAPAETETSATTPNQSPTSTPHNIPPTTSPSAPEIDTNVLVDSALKDIVDPVAPPPVPELPDILMPDNHEDSGELSIQDLEIEEEITITNSQSVLYLSGLPALPTLAFLKTLTELDIQLQATASAESLLAQAEQHPPTAIALIALDDHEEKQTIHLGMRKRPSHTKVPLFEVLCPAQKEAAIQLRWGHYQTNHINDQFWHRWIQQVHNKRDREEVILSIGFPDEKACSPLFHLFCGAHFSIRAYPNPVDGVQSLYQSPPQLLALQLGEDSTTWTSLFRELGNSARTKEVPLLLFGTGPLEENLKNAISPFNHILFTPRAKLI